jgi:hypothetical protein
MVAFLKYFLSVEEFNSELSLGSYSVSQPRAEGNSVSDHLFRD